MKQISMEIIEVVFVPRAIAKQLVLAIGLQAGAVTIKQVLAVLRWIGSHFSSRSRLIRQLKEQQNTATTQDEWMDLAERIDNIQGNDVWRSNPDCALYERDRISARIDEFVHLMRRRDIFDLMFTLRGGIGRNTFGLLHEGLFTKAIAGSKVLVETYHNVVCAALDFCCDVPVSPGEEPIPTEARLAFFNETRHSYGRTAILLSGGAALGFYHIGVVKALMDNGLMPRVLGGSSAGSIVCAMIATRTDEECYNDFFLVKGTNAPGHSGQLQYSFFRPIQKQDVAAKHSGTISEVYHNTAGAFHDAKLTTQVLVPIGLRRFTSLLYDIVTGNRRSQDLLMHDTEYFRECLRTNVGDFTFQEAFDRTGRILNIVVTPKNSTDPPRLLNYLTAPHVLVWSAAVASSSLPGVFEANKLMVKDADGTERFESAAGVSFKDGSMEADLPMQQIQEMFNVNHFIISQANPHAVMFASFDLHTSIWTNPIIGMMNGILLFLKDQTKTWFANVVELVGGRRLAPLFDTRRGVASQFFTQEYEGRDCDISLIPWIKHRGFFSALLHCIYNPSEEEFRDWIAAAERQTWKYIPAIKSHIAEEMTLDRCVQRLRKRLVMESLNKRKRQDSMPNKMGDRLPSFFTSPSLVNLGGMGITDQVKIQDTEDIIRHDPSIAMTTPVLANRPTSVINPGWGGMGLRGNHSSEGLVRTASASSGLFMDDDDKSNQDAGEQTMMRPKSPLGDTTTESIKDKDYIKTTSMAQFYYRKSGSQGDLRARSHEHLREAVEEPRPQHERKRSSSAAALGNMTHADLLKVNHNNIE
jgi:TAG lipase/steryl ester hydrolase/phospholipase A2/LPA acyltransferase